MDTAKRYYAKLRVNEIQECKLITLRHRVCKQSSPVQLTHLHEECEVEMLQSLRAIPSSCCQRIAEINQTVWTQLDGNEWLYVHSSRESLRLPMSKNCRIRGSMQEDALEESELVTLKTCSRQMVPSGKRQ